MFSVDRLRHVSLFSGLTAEQLQAVLQQGAALSVSEGEVFVREGDQAGDFFILLAGGVEFRTQQLRDREVHFIHYEPGDFFGHELILIGNPLYLGSGYATRDSDLLKFGETAFWQIIASHPGVIQKLLRTNAQRWQSYEALLQSQAKLTSLGTLAAGLAHELNNPAAALLRNSEYLDEVSAASSSELLKLSQKSLTNEQCQFLDDLRMKLSQQIKAEKIFDPLTQSALEEDIISWLEEQGVANSWKLATNFVAAGLDCEALQQISDRVHPNILTDVLIWLESTLNQARLITEIKAGASRITQLVQAIKDYSYMDQASLQEVDIHEGIESTLTVLNHKLSAEIDIIRVYAENLPRIQAYGSALNQVWTDLIDNAVDAMAGQGELKIHTLKTGNHIVVEIVDSGPGIPPDIQPRIFDPFFTTKAVGKGTGLGLDAARRIVVGQHKGDLQFTSQPGKTIFRVCLPLNHSL
ncbi:MAG: sensor histidine kinase [Leptolyngbyaceae cyanobacterium]